jgi:YegS/Rv2252/BmrU family lipid kinase
VRELLLIVNPAARGGRSAETEALAACAQVGLRVHVERTTAAGDAARIASQVTGTDPILVLGGDGTVMEVVGALVGRDVAVGILPGGTGNQLARHLRIPLRVGKAVRAIADAVPSPLDLGQLADGRYFSLTAGFGLDAAMIQGASHAAKRRFGVGAYIWSGTRAVLGTRPFAVRIEVDGTVYEREAGLAMVANVGAIMDGRLGLGPGVSPDDGLLDACIISPNGVTDGVVLASRMARRDFRDDPRLLFVRGQHVRLEVAEHVPAQADGELIGGGSLHARVVPAGALFLRPRPT